MYRVTSQVASRPAASRSGAPRSTSPAVLAALVLASGAAFGIAAQVAILHVGFDLPALRDHLLADRVAHSRVALSWWAWWLAAAGAFFVGPLSLALVRLVTAYWWFWRGLRLLATAAAVLALAALGHLPAATSDVDLAAHVVSAFAVALSAALLAAFGARLTGRARRKRQADAQAAPSARRGMPLRAGDQARHGVAAPFAPWRGEGSARYGVPFQRFRQSHSLVARSRSVGLLALLAMLALVVIATVAGLTGATVLHEHATASMIGRLAGAIDLDEVVIVPPPEGLGALAVAQVARTELARVPRVDVASLRPHNGMVLAGVYIPESELTFAKGFARRLAALEGARMLAAEPAQIKVAVKLEKLQVASLRIVKTRSAKLRIAALRAERRDRREFAAYPRRFERTAYPRWHEAVERRHADRRRAHDRHRRGRDRYAYEGLFRMQRF